MRFDRPNHFGVQQQLINQSLTPCCLERLNAQMQSCVQLFNRAVGLAAEEPAQPGRDDAVEQTNRPEQGEQNDKPDRQRNRFKQNGLLQPSG